MQSRRDFHWTFQWFQIYSGLLSRIHPICKAMRLVNTHPLLILKVLWRLLRLVWMVMIWLYPARTSFWSSFSVPGCPWRLDLRVLSGFYSPPLGAMSAIHHPTLHSFQPVTHLIDTEHNHLSERKWSGPFQTFQPFQPFQPFQNSSIFEFSRGQGRAKK